ncbi:quinone oxidoreductase family protein [Cellulomonas shaoxiangyii]|uniref:Quinone oxidoreductase n=1 Tax=Cellulomonas shaoxiangyii TaxID=2566013 RepID=A0A4P7SJ68_9CELL|nr:quinone oxidoreductase [Cellulomonas shaoxiangyii]QCB93851.1 quinone oxidoreductase [Cellulomonas shaoxiangyii]TGY84590.1 quinone oxidoreductase [Cellulomonas shaoxiangyii]
MRAVVATRAGGPEVLDVVDRPEPVPRPDEVLVRVAAAGVNFIDTYLRTGTYPTHYPHVVGSEGAGEVVAVGADVTTLAPGDRVAWADAPGSYAELVAVPERSALVVPPGLDDRAAAALPLQGMTAHYLTASTFPLEHGHDVLLHAAAGGVGLLLTQLAAARGAHVLATVGSAEKETLARAAGAADVIRYRELSDLTAELPALVRDRTGGRGVHVVYDSVGKDTFEASLASLRTRGTLVLFGGSSGQVPPFDLQRLNAGGSLFVTRPTLGHHTATRDELEWRWREVADPAAAGALDVRVGATFPLADAADAHRALEGRATTGKVLLLP